MASFFTLRRERLLLQAVVTIAAAVPVAVGAAGILASDVMLGRYVGIGADSHFRYLSGLLLGIGVAFWWAVPDIERRGGLFLALTLIVAAGGVARLYGALVTGAVGPAIALPLTMELVVTPLLCAWQHHLELRHERWRHSRA
jgi:hypothetical protein